MSAPKRIQLRRTKGWRKPEGTVVVSRPTKWGNPVTMRVAAAAFPQGDYRDGLYWSDKQRRYAVATFRSKLVAAIQRPWSEPHDIAYRIMAESIEELRGHDLACWCPLDQPCHADVLIELANREVTA